MGFRGDIAALAVIAGTGSAPPGTSWENGQLIIRTGGVALDHVWVKGGIDFYGLGTLTVTNSVVESNGFGRAVVMGRGAGNEIRISDSDIVWPADVPPPGDTWGNGAVHGDARMLLLRNDISGAPDGVQQSTGNVDIEQNYIHDLRSLPWTHNDGIQLYGGPGVVIRGNYITQDAGMGTVNAAVFLSDDGSGFTDPVIDNNYMSGGGFILRLEKGCLGARLTGNEFGAVYDFGPVSVDPGATVDEWSGNVAADGSVLPRP